MHSPKLDVFTEEDAATVTYWQEELKQKRISIRDTRVTDFVKMIATKYSSKAMDDMFSRLYKQ